MRPRVMRDDGRNVDLEHSARQPFRVPRREARIGAAGSIGPPSVGRAPSLSATPKSTRLIAVVSNRSTGAPVARPSET
jgi:hypothetical protein